MGKQYGEGEQCDWVKKTSEALEVFKTMNKSARELDEYITMLQHSGSYTNGSSDNNDSELGLSGEDDEGMKLFVDDRCVATLDEDTQRVTFNDILEEMEELYLRKNNDYNNSFDKSLDEDGLLVSKIRIGDKYHRFSQLIKKEAEVKDESIEDTLIDLANYSVMTLLWLRKNKEEL